jgi:hypothetical protein
MNEVTTVLAARTVLPKTVPSMRVHTTSSVRLVAPENRKNVKTPILYRTAAGSDPVHCFSTTGL